MGKHLPKVRLFWEMVDRNSWPWTLNVNVQTDTHNSGVSLTTVIEFFMDAAIFTDIPVPM
jgi:hypothetical protein